MAMSKKSPQNGTDAKAYQVWLEKLSHTTKNPVTKAVLALTYIACIYIAFRTKCKTKNFSVSANTGAHIMAFHLLALGDSMRSIASDKAMAREKQLSGIEFREAVMQCIQLGFKKALAGVPRASN